MHLDTAGSTGEKMDLQRWVLLFSREPTCCSVDGVFTLKADQSMTRNSSSVEGKFIAILLNDSGKAS